jgi:uncharacterized membrane protein YcaP (DUF421 family)
VAALSVLDEKRDLHTVVECQLGERGGDVVLDGGDAEVEVAGDCRVGFALIAVSWISFRSPKVRLATEGEPIILVQDGQIIERNLRRERLSHGDVEEEARKQQITSLEDVRWAILEKDGTIGFIPKS